MPIAQRRRPVSALALIRASEPKPNAPRKRSKNPKTEDFRKTVSRLAAHLWFEWGWAFRLDDEDGPNIWRQGPSGKHERVPLDRDAVVQTITGQGGEAEHVEAAITATLELGHKEIARLEKELQRKRATVAQLEAITAKEETS